MAGRPLTGSRKQLPNGRWEVSVPRKRGFKPQCTATFDDEASAAAWQAACIEALHIGMPLPDAAGFRLTVARRRYIPVTRDAVVRTYAEAWFQRHYIVNERAGGSRTTGVRGDIDNHIVDYFDAIGITRLDQVTPESTTDFANYLAGWPLAYHDATRQKQSPIAKTTAARVLSLLKKILEAAVHDGVLGRSPYSEVQARARRGDTKKLKKLPPVAIEDTARVVAHLPPIYQLAVWMMRLLGLRIGEVFGPRVHHVEDAEGEMTIMVELQGGSNFDPDRRELRSLTERRWELDEQLRRAAADRVRTFRSEPPRYLTSALGTQPTDSSSRTRWERTAVAIEHHRLRWQVTDPVNGLGSRVGVRGMQSDRSALRDEIERTVEDLQRHREPHRWRGLAR